MSHVAMAVLALFLGHLLGADPILPLILLTKLGPVPIETGVCPRKNGGQSLLKRGQPPFCEAWEAGLARFVLLFGVAHGGRRKREKDYGKSTWN